jgi:hypothetical protein
VRFIVDSPESLAGFALVSATIFAAASRSNSMLLLT